MQNSMIRFLASRWGMILSGGLFGVMLAISPYLGNPPNAGLCVACFQKDIAGAIGLHRIPSGQYIRPEIIGIVLGALLAALLLREFKPRSGSSPMIRFLLGMLAMIGTLAFMGCPWRVFQRLAGGDMTALAGLAGLIGGIAVGIGFLRSGFTLGNNQKSPALSGWVISIFMACLLILLIWRPKVSPDGPIYFSTKGLGSLHAPLLFSLGFGLLIGFLAQRTRFCTIGAIRDSLLFKNFHLLSGVIAMTVTVLITNIFLGRVHLGLTLQPFAHSDHIWNFLAMLQAGIAFSLAGGCPARQLILSGEGDSDAGIFVLGMLAGTAFMQNFLLNGKEDELIGQIFHQGGLSPAGKTAVLFGIIMCLVIGFARLEKD